MEPTIKTTVELDEVAHAHYRKFEEHMLPSDYDSFILWDLDFDMLHPFHTTGTDVAKVERWFKMGLKELAEVEDLISAMDAATNRFSGKNLEIRPVGKYIYQSVTELRTHARRLRALLQFVADYSGNARYQNWLQDYDDGERELINGFTFDMEL